MQYLFITMVPAALHGAMQNTDFLNTQNREMIQQYIGLLTVCASILLSNFNTMLSRNN